jgi:hypothetical protein
MLVEGFCSPALSAVCDSWDSVADTVGTAYIPLPPSYCKQPRELGYKACIYLGRIVLVIYRIPFLNRANHVPHQTPKLNPPPLRNPRR